MAELTYNFRDAKGRCLIAGTPVHPDAYAEFEAAWAEVERLRAEVVRLTDGIREAIKVCDAKGYPNVGWLLWSLLDVAGDDGDPADARCTHKFPLPSWMGPDQDDPCRCDLAAGHEGDHSCEHLRAKAVGDDRGVVLPGSVEQAFKGVRDDG